MTYSQHYTHLTSIRRGQAKPC